MSARVEPLSEAPAPRRRVYMICSEMLDRIRARQIEGGHASEVDTVRYLLTDALARWDERRAAKGAAV